MSDIAFGFVDRPGVVEPIDVPRALSRRAERVGWVDYAKGWSIILVVTMHSALGVGFAVGETGWLHELVAFAKPFRMPDFFLVAGLFAGSAMARPWRDFVDRKVAHFAYFYALWLFIALAVKSAELDLTAPSAFIKAYLYAFVEPFGSMWFIHLLPFLYVVSRLTRDWPATVILAIALGMHVLAAMFPEGGAYAMASRMTGWTAADSFFLFFVYFQCGALFADRVFAFAGAVARRPGAALILLLLWATVEEVAVTAGLPQVPGATLVFGLAGALAVVVLSALLARTGLFAWLAYCGRNSLVIYLAFFAPMAATRIVLLKTGIVADVGWMSLIVAVVAVGAPLALSAMVRGTVLGLLFTRPSWARLERPARRSTLQQAAIRA